MNNEYLSSSVIRPTEVLHSIATLLGKPYSGDSFRETITSDAITISAAAETIKILVEFLLLSGIEPNEVDEYFIKVPFFS